ncbi:MAG: hypothetical protein U0414_23155 [Polyangiaceae bacterium]
MKGRTSYLVAGALAALGAVVVPHAAHAQAVPPVVSRDGTWGIVSSISMAIGAGTVSLMPRIYYNDPESTVGWKARWHVSQLAPVLLLTTAAFMIDGPIKEAIQSTRPGCSLDGTLVRIADSGCETFGGPSTHSFVSWSATGAGVGIWVADTFIHSDGNVHAGSIIGNIVVPTVAAVLTSVGRGIETTGNQAFENGGQIGAGVAVGLPLGFLTGLAYGVLAKPNCGYGNNLFCW